MKFRVKAENCINFFVFLFFVFQQFGFSYHFSLASFGLFLIVFTHLKRVTKMQFYLAYALSASIIIPYFWVVIKYHYYDDLTRGFRYFINAFFLFLLLGIKKSSIKIPTTIVFITVLLLFVLSFLQVFVSSSFQVPLKYFSNGSNLGFIDSSLTHLYSVSPRANAIYSEPSYFGMVLTCLLVMVTFLEPKVRFLLSSLIIISCFLSGSLLGFFGISGVLFVRYVNNKYFLIVFFVFLFFTFVALFFVINNSILNARLGLLLNGDDTSASVRMVKPFYLVFQNLNNWDLFGVPNNNFKHFLYTKLYTNDSDFPGHNGIMVLFTSFGILAPIYVWLCLQRLQYVILIILFFIIGSQNGNFFSYEKVFTILYMTLLIKPLLQRELITSHK